MGNHNAEKRRRLLKQGKALPNSDGPPRFPIEDASDLDNATGLARTPEERRHVYKCAKQMGKLGKIPARWKADGTLRGE